MSCFAAGMLIALSIGHIMPESNEIYAKYQEEHAHENEVVGTTGEEEHHEGEEDHEGEEHEGEEHEDEEHEGEEHEGEEHDHDEHADEEEHTFPLPNFLFIGGFLMILLFDQVLFKSLGNDKNGDDKEFTASAKDMHLKHVNNPDVGVNNMELKDMSQEKDNEFETRDDPAE